MASLRSLWVFGLLFVCSAVVAEPYLAVRTGFKCMACHVNPSGGGKRTALGRSYGQSVLPAEPAAEPLGEIISRYLDIGADFRISAIAAQSPATDDEFAFNTDRANIYLQTKLIPDRLTLYLDQQFAPASDSREAWLLLQYQQGSLWFKAGRLFLPYGLRLEDDTAFIRAIPGINFSTPDNGIEAGLEQGAWSAQLAVTNGTASGAETNTDKQLSVRVEYIKPRWRLGGSANTNSGGGGIRRDMLNVFGGVNLFGSEWLFEIDRINDEISSTGDIEQIVTLFEVNRQVAQGHNVKLTLEYLDPDTDVSENQRNRSSLVWEYTPMALLQLRAGVRIAEGIPQNNAQNTDNLFVQLHAWY